MSVCYVSSHLPSKTEDTIVAYVACYSAMIVAHNMKIQNSNAYVAYVTWTTRLIILIPVRCYMTLISLMKVSMINYLSNQVQKYNRLNC